MHEDIGAAFVGLDKTEAFIRIEEFDGASVHRAIPFPR
jgi:hypothetical protein